MTISPVTNTSAESLELVSTSTVIEPKPVTDLRLLLNPEQQAIFKEPSVRKLLYSDKVFEQNIVNTSNIRSV